MKKIYSILALICLGAAVSAQDFNIEWQNTVGGAGGDSMRALFPTDDGGCVIAGGSFSEASGDKSEGTIGPFGEDDYWIVKLDANGDVEWENTIGGDQTDTPWSIKQTTDGGYIIGGDSLSNASGDKTEDAMIFDYWIVKLDSDGIIEWENTIGGSQFDRDPTVMETSDGGFLVGGTSDSGISGDKTEANIGDNDFWALKLNSNGVIQWQNTIGGTGSDRLHAMGSTSDGGYLLAGVSASNISGDKTENSRGESDYWLVKINATGTVQWDKTIGGPGVDVLESVYQTSEGGYVLGGYSSSDAGGEKSENTLGFNDYWIVKLDAARTVTWENTIGAADFEDLGYTYQSDDGGYVVIGQSNSNSGGDKTEDSNGSYDLWLIKLDASGNIVGQETIGGSEADSLFFGEFAPSGSDLYIVCTSFSGISGDKTENNVGANDYWALKLSGILANEDFGIDNTIGLYPNPTQDVLYISSKGEIQETKIFTVKGDLVQTVVADDTLRSIEVSGLPSGIYFLQITSEGKTTTKRFVKQ